MELSQEMREAIKEEVKKILKVNDNIKKGKIEDLLDKIGTLGDVWFSKEKASDLWYCNLGNGEDIVNSCQGLDARRAVTNLYLFCIEKGLLNE